MPRPPYKRTKLNHATPSKRVATTSTVSPIVELRQKLANKPLGRVLTDSDDSDRLVTSNRNGRNRRGIPRKEIYASGGVGLGDVPGAHRLETQKSQASQKLDARKNEGQAKQGAIQARERPRAPGNPVAGQQKQVAQLPEKRNALSQSSPAALGGPSSISRAPAGLHSTPAAETSILGTIKPRRRQPSILQLIENNDSSNVGEEDEANFLPNDESTPLHHSSAQLITSTPSLSLSYQSVSRKRKLSPPIPLVPASQKRDRSPRRGNRHQPTATDEGESEPEVPPPRSAATPLRLATNSDGPDIMAPPLSSSPLQSPITRTIPSTAKEAPSKSQRKPAAPSTDELRALMPARRQRKGRLRTRLASEFDIPADANSEDSDGVVGPGAGSDDDLSFRAEIRGRTSKATQRRALTAKRPNNARIKGTVKSTISLTKAVTPLKRAATQELAAKSSLSQQPGHGSAAPKTKAIYSSRRRDTYGDKENRPVDLSGNFSGAERENTSVDDEDDSLAQSIEEPKQQPSKEMESVARKFADVDNWEMDFEDVSLGENSSPDRR